MFTTTPARVWILRPILNALMVLWLSTFVWPIGVYGQTLLSLNQPATASTVQSPNLATNGNDGNFTTRWAASSSTFPQWWRVDLGSMQKISQAIIYWYSYTNRYYQYRIDISSDDINYSTLVDATGNTNLSITTNNFSASARYVRIYVTACSVTGGFAGFYEAQIFGSPILQPYTADANTLFLFHLDEPAGGSADTNIGTVGGTAYTVNASGGSSSPPLVTNCLGAPAYSGFGTAANMDTPGYLIGFDAANYGYYSGETPESIPMSTFNMGNGGQTPWTLEAMIYPTVTNANQEIITTDSSASTRGFQFRLNTAGQLELNFINGVTSGTADILTPIPSSGANGFAANNWYHVAAVYDGTNVVLYWTLVTPSTYAANAISTNTVAVGSTFGAILGPLGLGGRTRGANTEFFQGIIDEVRISNIARPSNQMLFNAPSGIYASATSISPANPVYAGSIANLSATVGGTGPFTYSWQGDGGSSGVNWTNLPASTTNAYSLNTTDMSPGSYQFRMILSSASGSFTNTPASMTLLAASGPVLVSDTAIAPSSAAFVGNMVSVSAVFTGTTPLSYQWYFSPAGGNPAAIPGATNSSYVISGVQTNNAGSYFVIVSNNPPGLGSKTASSSPIILTVLQPSNPTPGMFCELLGYPAETVITAQNPKLSWFYSPAFRNDYQTGYQIIVASSQSLANTSTGDMWNSGPVSNSISINIPYAGTLLSANTNYFWRFRTLNSLGQWSAYSPIQQFNTAPKLSNPLTTAGVVYQQPSAGNANCYPPRYISVAPVLVTNTAPGAWFIDFGADAFGYASFHINGNFSGTNVSFGIGELAANNTINTSPGATIRYYSGNIALQNGSNTYRAGSTTGVGTISPPTATYGIVAPFRYLQLSGVPNSVTLTTSDLSQQRLQTEFDDNAATLNSSSPALNQVWALCKYSMKALSFDGIYVDGDRERTPYEADTYIHQMCAYGVFDDFTTPRCSFEYLTNHMTWPTEWKFHLIFTAWADYLQTGDPYLITKYYGFLTNSCLMLNKTGSDGLVLSSPVSGNTASGDIIDWYRISGDTIGNIDGYVPESTNAVINAFVYRCLTIMTNVAQITGHTADATIFGARITQMYTNYNNDFWNSSSQSYIDGEGTTHSSADANFFPLAFGLVPATGQFAVVNYLHSRLAAKNGMPAGVYGAQYLLEGLFLADDADTALDLITTNNTRSWLNMINIGSTITDEAWSTADKVNEDWNHAWGAAPGNLIPRYVLGLRPLTPGYGQILIQPQLGKTLSFVQGTVPTIRGSVGIFETNVSGQFQMLLNVPGNVTTTVMLPGTNATAIVDGFPVSGVLSTDSLANVWLTLTNIGSGQHAVWTSSTTSPSQTTLYNNWASSWFGTNASNPAIAGPSADPDGDGVDNFDEFIAGTDPTNPLSRFTLATGTPTNLPPYVPLTFQGLAGRSYILLRTPTLNPQVWTPVLTNSTLSTNQILHLADPNPPPNQSYYRVLITMP